MATTMQPMQKHNGVLVMTVGSLALSRRAAVWLKVDGKMLKIDTVQYV
jgi:hypothetical protein